KTWGPQGKYEIFERQPEQDDDARRQQADERDHQVTGLAGGWWDRRVHDCHAVLRRDRLKFQELVLGQGRLQGFELQFHIFAALLELRRQLAADFEIPFGLRDLTQEQFVLGLRRLELDGVRGFAVLDGCDLCP